MKPRQLALLRLALLAVASVLSLTGQVPTSPARVDIPGVSPMLLERAGITLLPPDAAPQISADQARSVAESENMTFGLPIQATVLVRLVDVNAVPQVDRLVWVNMIDDTGQLVPVPKHYPSTPAQNMHTFYLIFIDANTGKYMYALVD